MSGVEASDCEIVERNFTVTWRLLAESAGLTLRGDSSLGWFHAGADDPHCNAVLETRLDASDADTRIDRILGELRALGAPFYWWVMPGATPDDLGSRLAARGLEPEAPWPGMVAHAPSVRPPAGVAGLEVRRVTSDEELEVYIGVFAPILSPSSAFTDLFAAGARRLGYGADAPEQHFVAWLSGEPVATATLVAAGGAAGIYNVTTTEAARGRGIGAAVTFAAIAAGVERGLQVAALQASRMGRPVYERLGFRYVCDLVPYRSG